MKIDMHIHTKYSDGTLTIEQILEKAKRENLNTLAITDHDTCINLQQYKKLEQKYSLNIIPGIEITTAYKRVHILGLGIKEFKTIDKIATMYRDKCIESCIESAKKIIADNIDITLDDVYNHSKNKLVTKNGIIRAMISKKIVESYEDANKQFFAVDSKYHIQLQRMPVEEAIDLIKYSGGIPVLAHPFYSKFKENEMDEEINNLAKQGIEGIEAYYGKNKEYQTEKSIEFSDKYNLFRTAGSDFHARPNKDIFGMLVNEDLEILKYLI
ncbi:MAG: PHP domain-containing protein [Clostridia bacterium]